MNIVPEELKSVVLDVVPGLPFADHAVVYIVEPGGWNKFWLLEITGGGKLYLNDGLFGLLKFKLDGEGRIMEKEVI